MRIINTYLRYHKLILVLIITIISLPFVGHTYLHILKNKISYVCLFIFCGVLVSITAKLYNKKIFIRYMTIYIFTILCLDFLLTYVFLLLAFGGQEGASILKFLNLIPGEYLIYSLSTKYTAISSVIYSFWLLVYVFVSEHFFNAVKIENPIYIKLLFVGYLFILFYPALYFYFFNSKILLRQLMY